MPFNLPFALELPQVGFYDFFVGIALFCAFATTLMLGFLAKGNIKLLIFCLCVVLFFALPFFNLLIVDNFINKVAFTDNGSKKLVYIDSFLLEGTLHNQGKASLKKCAFNLYVNNRFAISPDYRVILQNLNLRVGGKVEIEQSIDNLKEATIKKIALRCY